MDGKLEGIGWVSGRARHHKEALTDAKILSDTINGSYTNSICQIDIPEKNGALPEGRERWPTTKIQGSTDSKSWV